MRRESLTAHLGQRGPWPGVNSKYSTMNLSSVAPAMPNECCCDRDGVGGDLVGFMPSTQATAHGHLLFPDRHSKCLVNSHVRCLII